MNSRRLMPSMGFLQGWARSAPSCARPKDSTSAVVAGGGAALQHLGPVCRGVLIAMGHKHRISVLLSPAFMSEMAAIPTEFCAPQRKSLSAINRHNQQLFDQLVGAQHDRWGYGKAERVGGLAVQNHLELGRKLHWE